MMIDGRLPYSQDEPSRRGAYCSVRNNHQSCGPLFLIHRCSARLPQIDLKMILVFFGLHMRSGAVAQVQTAALSFWLLVLFWSSCAMSLHWPTSVCKHKYAFSTPATHRNAEPSSPYRPIEKTLGSESPSKPHSTLIVPRRRRQKPRPLTEELIRQAQKDYWCGLAQ